MVLRCSVIFVSLEGPGLAQGNSILNSLQSFTASTIPPNGDLNPYGMAFVPAGFPSGGATVAGDVLVANFNNSGSPQGTRTTSVSLSPTGQQSVSRPPVKPGWTLHLACCRRASS